MTKLRVRVLAPLNNVDYSHMRHFFEGLLACPRADVTTDPNAEADYTFGGSKKPGSGRTALLASFDPHALPNDYDPRPLISQARVAMLSTIEQRSLWTCLENRWHELRTTRYSLADTCEKVGLDLLFLLARHPFREHLAPALKQAQLMRCSISVPEHIFFCTGQETRDVDVFFLGAVSVAHPIRLRLLPELRQAADINFVEQPVCAEYIQNSWEHKGFFDLHQRQYADRLRRARIMAFDGSVWDWPTGKYFEAAACGALVCAPMPHDGPVLGFRDGVNMVTIDGRNSMDRIRYYLAHEAERAEIAANGAALIREHHTCSARADQIVERFEMFATGMSAADIEADFDSRLL